MGQYVSVVRSGVEAVLSLCEVEVFSSSGLSIASCTEAANPDQLAVFDDSCFHFLNEEIAGKQKINICKISLSCQISYLKSLPSVFFFYPQYSVPSVPFFLFYFDS